MSIFIGGMWMGWPSSAVEKFVRHEADFDVDMDQLSWIVAMMDLGNVVSPLIAGYLMDRLGRKTVMVALGPLFTITWLLALYVPTTAALYAARLLAGLGKGISYTVVPVFLGEVAGPSVRGALSSVFCLQLHAGFLFEAIVGPLTSYRTLNVMSAVFPFAYLLAIVWVPESPHYLLAKDRPDRAERNLRWFRCPGAGAGAVDAELRLTETAVRQEMENRSTFRELFGNRKDVRALAVVVAACAAQRAGGVSCILAYSSLILPPEPADVGPGRSFYVILFGVLLVLVNIVGAAVVDRVGRKPLLVGSEAGLAVITFTMAVYFYALGEAGLPSPGPWLPYLCYVLFAVLFGSGLGFIPVVYLGELFPVNVRSHCSAIASITLAVCSFVTNKMFLLVSRRYGFHVMFALFAVVNAAGAAFSYRYAIETKGKTFAEIQQLLREVTGDDGPLRPNSDARKNDEGLSRSTGDGRKTDNQTAVA